MKQIFIMIALFGLLAGHNSQVSAQQDKPIADAALEAKARKLMEEIRCVVCQNQSIVDSNAEIAADLRRIVRAQIKNGESPDAIKAFLVERYGDWVLLKPPLNTGTIILWSSPLLFILVAGFILLNNRKSTAAGNIQAPLSDEETEALHKILSDDTLEEPKA